MNSSRRLPPPDFSCPTSGTVIRSPVFNWQPPPGNSFSGNGNWFQPPGACSHSSVLNSNTGPVPVRRYDGQCFRAGYPHHMQGRGHMSRNKKKKREPVFTHFCDTCDRGFKNQEKYEEHMGEHVKCSVKDCTFTAHEKIVKIHWRNSHAPGMKRIKLDTPDEIAKWREERRKNYPTLSNIERKRKIMEERTERGEVLETAQFGRMRGRGRGFRQRGGRFQNNQRRGWTRPGALERVLDEDSRPPPRQVPRDGDPLGAIVNSDPDTDKDEAVDGGAETLTVTPKQVTSGLGALVANYGSMSESDSEQEPDDLPVLKVSKVLEENQTMLRAATEKTQHRLPFQGLRPPPSSSMARPSAAPNRPCRGGRPNKGSAAHQRRHPTLLEMLLAPEIRHERNVLLQCVRFIVRNRFFGLDRASQGSLSSDSGSSAALGEKRLPLHMREDKSRCPVGVCTPCRSQQEGWDHPGVNAAGGGQGSPEAGVLAPLGQGCVHRALVGDPQGSTAEDGSGHSGQGQSDGSRHVGEGGMSSGHSVVDNLAEEYGGDADASNLMEQDGHGQTRDGGCVSSMGGEEIHEEPGKQNVQSTGLVVDDEIWEMPIAIDETKHMMVHQSHHLALEEH